jgi:hypothetical protein
MKKLLIDMDYIKYQIGAAGEKRTVDVIHKATGRIKNFDTRTAFYGHWKTKSGGFLAETNLSRMQDGKKPFAVEEFVFVDKQQAEPVEFILSSVKNHINNMAEKLGVDEYYGYIGKGDSWRVEASTIVKYKGSRSSLLKPVHLEEVEKYLITNHQGIIKRGLEADDHCVIDCTNDPELILAGVDKDYFGNNLKFYIHGEMQEPQKIEGFGSLYVNDKGAVKGHGYIWWLHQICSGDDSDEYWANSACPEKRWGDKSSYKALKDCKNEREAWEAAIKVYKNLYPAPKVITGWRGNQIEVDAKYVLNENCVMSKMMTSEDYKFDLDAELDKYGVKL